MRRFEVLRVIVETLKDEYVICNIGIPSKELYYLKDRSQNFYMMGSMGLASSIALGVALSQPKKKIWCIEGDGSLLMNLGSLCTIANANPINLTLIVIDNASYGSTGDQMTYTGKETKLDIIAEGAGFKSVKKVRNVEEIKKVLLNSNKGCQFILVRVEAGSVEVDNIPLLPKEIKDRFIKSISEK